MTLAEAKRPTIDWLRERCRFWQARLRLEDWDIDLRLLRRHAMKTPGMANARINVYHRVKIELLDPLDFEPDDWPSDTDLEVSLVHELLHSLFDDAVGRPKEESLEHRALERAIEQTAVALVRLAREPA